MSANLATSWQDDRTNLMNLDLDGLKAFFVEIGEKPFRAQQVLKWIHQAGELDIDAWSNLSKSLRDKLKSLGTIRPLTVDFDHLSEDGTRKWLLSLPEGNRIETVYIPERGRGTLCVSSQVGCALNCQFCATATQGFNRNLTLAEIIGQVWHAVHTLKADGQRVTNVVMMGMGEPLLNYDNVVKAMNMMMHDLAYGLSKYRVTLSTSGVVPNLLKLNQDTDAALAVSLHAPNDELRTQLVPINKKYPIKMLLDACAAYFPADSKRAVTFEYVMLRGVNDKPEHARQLVKLLGRLRAKVNLIPFNPYPGARYVCSTRSAIETFRAILERAGVINTVRKTRGDDIAAACGQLVGDFTDRTSRSRLMSQKAEADGFLSSS